MDVTLKLLDEVDLDRSAITATFYRANIRTREDLDYCYTLCKVLGKLDDIYLRVESPWVAVYTNTKKHVDKIVKIDENRVKYVSIPAANTVLEEGTIILPKINFDYKVTVGSTKREHSAFIEWAEKSDKVKLTKSCIKHLLKDTSWGGSYFYISGEKNLLVAKMHLGGDINKIERILKA